MHRSRSKSHSFRPGVLVNLVDMYGNDDVVAESDMPGVFELPHKFTNREKARLLSISLPWQLMILVASELAVHRNLRNGVKLIVENRYCGCHHALCAARKSGHS